MVELKKFILFNFANGFHSFFLFHRRVHRVGELRKEESRAGCCGKLCLKGKMVEIS